MNWRKFQRAFFAIFEFPIAHPWCSILMTIAFAGFFIAFSSRTRTIQNVDYFLVQDADYEFWQHTREIFKNDEFFVIAFSQENLFTNETLTTIAEITTAIESLPDVREVKSLTNVSELRGSEDYFDTGKLIESLPAPPEELLRIRNSALSNTLYVPHMVSADGRTASIVVYPQETPDDESFRARLMSQVRAILAPFEARGITFRAAGWTVTNLTLANILNEDLAILVPLSYIIIAVTTFALFRNWIITALAVGSMTLTLLSLYGFFGFSDIVFNNLTSTVLPLAITMCLADAIHIFSHLDPALIEKHSGTRPALCHLIRHLVKPCLLTSLTTAAGFLSVAVSKIPAMKDFACVSAAAMIFEFIFTFFLIVPLLAILPHARTFHFSSEREDDKIRLLLSRIFNFVAARRLSVIVAAVLLSFAGAYFTAQVSIETNVHEYFKESSDIRRSLAFVEERLSGVTTIDIAFTADQMDRLKEPEALKLIEKVQQHIDTLKGVDATLSFVDFLKDMNRAFHNHDQHFYSIPPRRDTIEQYLLLYDARDIDQIMDSSYQHARIVARTHLASTKSLRLLIEQVQAFLASLQVPSGVDIRITGQALNFVNIGHEMVDSQVSSFGTATLIIAVLMMVMLGSVSLGIVSLIPNVFPILMNFGTMGLLSVPLNTGTVMIASVALGIAVDDTIHFLTAYRTKRETLTRPDALRAVMMLKGRAIFSSTIIISIGFGVLVIGQFIPVINFGALTALVIWTALAAELTLLPAVMLLGTSPRGDSKETHS